jgi:hypothetical protein
MVLRPHSASEMSLTAKSLFGGGVAVAVFAGDAFATLAREGGSLMDA